MYMFRCILNFILYDIAWRKEENLNLEKNTPLVYRNTRRGGGGNNLFETWGIYDEVSFQCLSEYYRFRRIINAHRTLLFEYRNLILVIKP